jgi:hypothetical protein
MESTAFPPDLIAAHFKSGDKRKATVPIPTA